MRTISAKKPTKTVGDKTFEAEPQRDGRIAFRAWPSDGGRYSNGQPEFHEAHEVPPEVRELKPKE